MDVTSIAGRDDLIPAKALIYAIAAIQAIPPEKQEWSDVIDMCALAGRLSPVNSAVLAHIIRSQTGITPDIWPDDREEHFPEKQAKRASYAANYKAKLPKRARLTPLEFLRPTGGSDA